MPQKLAASTLLAGLLVMVIGLSFTLDAGAYRQLEMAEANTGNIEQTLKEAEKARLPIIGTPLPIALIVASAFGLLWMLFGTVYLSRRNVRPPKLQMAPNIGLVVPAAAPKPAPSEPIKLEPLPLPEPQVIKPASQPPVVTPRPLPPPPVPRPAPPPAAPTRPIPEAPPVNPLDRVRGPNAPSPGTIFRPRSPARRSL